MQEDLDHVRLKLRALGFNLSQITSIIEGTLSGRQWEDMEPGERVLVLNSLNARIGFYKTIVRAFCKCCDIS